MSEIKDTITPTNPRKPWNKGKMIGAKPPLRPKHAWSIRTKLQVEGRKQDLALFNLAIDSKLCGLRSASSTITRSSTGWCRTMFRPISKGVYAKGDRAVLLDHNSLRNTLAPATLNRLANIKLRVETVTEMDRMVNVDGLTPRDAAKKWLAAHPIP